MVGAAAMVTESGALAEGSSPAPVAGVKLASSAAGEEAAVNVVVQVAVYPEAVRATGWAAQPGMATAPLVKATVPDGVPECGVTVAVTVTGWLVTGSAGVVETVVVELAGPAAAQLPLVAVPSVWVETTCDASSGPSAGVPLCVRLLVSAVYPRSSHPGTAGSPSARSGPASVVTASSVVPAPKSAWSPSPSPNTPNSAVFQCSARSTLLSGTLSSTAIPEPVDIESWSSPPAVALPTNFTVARSAAVSEGVGVVTLFV